MSQHTNIKNSLTAARRAQVVNGNPSFSQLRVGPDPRQQIAAEIANLSGTQFIAYPPDFPKYYFGMGEYSVSRFNLDSGADGMRPEKGYRLPLPLHLQDAHSVQYDHSFNWFNFLNSATLNLATHFTNAVGAAGGFAINQLKQVTIQSPEFRTFSFDWKLSPKNAGESKLIRDIYFNIKKGMLPEAWNAGFGNVTFKFPRVYRCYFAPNAEWLFNFKPAVITACQIDYNGGNPQPAFYKDTGAPESIILRLAFLEIDYWISEDMNLDIVPGGRDRFLNAGSVVDFFRNQANPGGRAAINAAGGILDNSTSADGLNY